MAAPTRIASALATRGSEGVHMLSGCPNLAPESNFPRVDSRNCKVMSFSQDGSLFAFCDGHSVTVLTTADYRMTLQIDKPRTIEIDFSPQNTYIVTWEPHFVTKDNPHGTPNLNIWEVKSGRHMKGLFQKKRGGWCPQWSLAEEICGRNVNNEIQFYENNNFDVIVHKLHLQKVVDFKLAYKSKLPYHVAAYVAGSKGQPSFVRIYRYPNFGGPQSALANKSFYMSDKVDLIWNNRGSHLLVLTATDTSTDSYYGDQGLHFISTDGDSCLVPRGKNGPVYSVEWNPKSTDFCVVYGFMPAKVTMYNLKCEVIFDFGTGPRNVSYYNPHGTVLCLAGFGNLGGNLEFWAVGTQNIISKVEARDTTYFEWAPDGKHVVTATTSPRLRVGNGLKIWDFTGAMLEHRPTTQNEELWDVNWRPAESGTHPEPKLPFGRAAAVTLAKAEAAKPKAYVPPGLRNKIPGAPTATKYREQYEPASNVKNQPQEPEGPPKTAEKNRKKREARARKREQEKAKEQGAAAAPASTPSAPAPAAPAPAAPAPAAQAPAAQASQSAPVQQTQPAADPEKDKKIKNLSKKLSAIKKLKEQQLAGKKLEVNQLEKLSNEDALREELELLKLG